jgi:hypothetical protein
MGAALLILVMFSQAPVLEVTVPAGPSPGATFSSFRRSIDGLSHSSSSDARRLAKALRTDIETIESTAKLHSVPDEYVDSLAEDAQLLASLAARTEVTPESLESLKALKEDLQLKADAARAAVEPPPGPVFTPATPTVPTPMVPRLADRPPRAAKPGLFPPSRPLVAIDLTPPVQGGTSLLPPIPSKTMPVPEAPTAPTSTATYVPRGFDVVIGLPDDLPPLGVSMPAPDLGGSGRRPAGDFDADDAPGPYDRLESNQIGPVPDVSVGPRPPAPPPPRPRPAPYHGGGYRPAPSHYGRGRSFGGGRPAGAGLPRDSMTHQNGPPLMIGDGDDLPASAQAPGAPAPSFSCWMRAVRVQALQEGRELTGLSVYYIGKGHVFDKVASRSMKLLGQTRIDEDLPFGNYLMIAVVGELPDVLERRMLKEVRISVPASIGTIMPPLPILLDVKGLIPASPLPAGASGGAGAQP